MHQRKSQIKNIYTGLCAVTLAFAVEACSGKAEFGGLLSDKSTPLQQSRVEQTGPIKQPQPGESTGDDQEMPTVEVAGVNLTTDCFDLKMPGRAEDSAAVECSIRSNADDEKPTAVKFEKIGLKGSKDGKIIVPVGMSADRHKDDPSAFAVSKTNPMSMSFEVSNAEIPFLKKSGMSLVLSELSINQKPISFPPTLKTDLHDYFVSPTGCADNSKVLLIPLRFDLKALHIDVNTENKYNVRWAYTAIPDLDKATDGSNKPLNISKSTLSALQVCEAQFQNALRFEWSKNSYEQTRRVFTLLRGNEQKHELVMTNLAKLSTVFRTDPLAFFAHVSRTPYPYAQVVQRANPFDAAEEWCVMGRSGCFDASRSGDRDTEYLHLESVPSSYWSKNINKVLMFADGTDSGLLVRVVNSINSGRTKNSNCYPDSANVIKQGSGYKVVGDQIIEQCDDDIPPPPRLNTPVLRVQYLSP